MPNATSPVRRFSTLAASFCALLIAGGALAGDAMEDRARRLADLRAQVEDLSARLEDERSDARARLRALRSQRADLEARLSSERIREAQAEGRLADARAAVQAGGTDPELVAALEDGRAAVVGAIRASIPFRTGDRVAALDEVLQRVVASELSPEQGVSRLWGAVEDELRLGGEVALHRQSVDVDGVEQLVEVAHLGFVALYFKTGTGQFGVAEREGEAWRWRVLDDRAARTELDDLFGSLRKGVREGWFPLPAAPGGAS